MSLHTIEPEKQTLSIQPAGGVPVPPLQSGDRLSRAEFERRYQAHFVAALKRRLPASGDNEA